MRLQSQLGTRSSRYRSSLKIFFSERRTPRLFGQRKSARENAISPFNKTRGNFNPSVSSVPTLLSRLIEFVTQGLCARGCLCLDRTESPSCSKKRWFNENHDDFYIFIVFRAHILLMDRFIHNWIGRHFGNDILSLIFLAFERAHTLTHIFTTAARGYLWNELNTFA